MTTDPHTEAARRDMDPGPTGQNHRAWFVAGAEWDRALAATAIEQLAPAAVEHWRWSEKQRARHGDEGCVCTTCELFRALRTIRRDAKAEAWGEYAAALEAVPDYAPTEYDRGRVDQRHATIEELHARAARRDEGKRDG